jgi:methyl-accepting chemotaxis protein
VTALRSADAQEELEAARSDVILWSGVGDLARRLVELEAAWAALGPDAGSTLRSVFLSENPFPANERFRLTDPGGRYRYSAIHAEFQPVIQEFLDIHGYHDVLLLNPSARVVYSFRKAEDFGAGLLDEPWRETPLGHLAQTTLRLPPGTPALSDFEDYPTRGGKWSLFVGAPIHGEGGEGGDGALVLEISPEHIGQHLSRTSQQRESAAAGILGEGYSLFGHAPWIGEEDAEDPVAYQVRLEAESEPSGGRVMEGPDGGEVLVSWQTDRFEGVGWVVYSRIDLDDLRSDGAGHRRAIRMTAFILWLALGALTLGYRGRTTQARHTI